MPITVTNNAFSLKDILKEELVIDLAKIADEMPKNGYSVITTVNPSFGWNLNIKDFHFSSFVGVDTFEKFTISKDLFEFFGYGNELYEDLSVAMTTNVDVFAHLDTKASFKAGDFGISIEPSFFLPVAHATTEESKIVVKNDAEGNLGTELIAKAALYTVADYENISDINAELINTYSITTDMLPCGRKNIIVLAIITEIISNAKTFISAIFSHI